MGFSEGGLNAFDANKDSPLHYACRGANYGPIIYLLERKTLAVSNRNRDNKLPIQILCEAGEKRVENESHRYTETIWRLLFAYPGTTQNW